MLWGKIRIQIHDICCNVRDASFEGKTAHSLSRSLSSTNQTRQLHLILAVFFSKYSQRSFRFKLRKQDDSFQRNAYRCKSNKWSVLWVKSREEVRARQRERKRFGARKQTNRERLMSILNAQNAKWNVFRQGGREM